MKTIEEIAFEYAKEKGFDDWNAFDEPLEYWEVSQRYAQQYIDRVKEFEDVLKDINFQYFWNGNDLTIHHKDKIESLINKGKDNEEI